MKKLIFILLLLASPAAFSAECALIAGLSTPTTSVFAQTGLDLNDTGTISCEVDGSESSILGVEIQSSAGFGTGEIQIEITNSENVWGNRGAVITANGVTELDPFAMRKARVSVPTAKGSAGTFSVWFSVKRSSTRRER